MTSAQPDARDRTIEKAAYDYAVATADAAEPELYTPLTSLLAKVREALHMDVVFVSRFVDGRRIFEVVSCEGESMTQLEPGNSDPLLDTYCQRVVDGRLPKIIPDTSMNPQAHALGVTAALRIKAYLSASVVLPDGTVFGTVCCISHSPRADLQEDDARALEAVAQAVAASVEMRKGRIRHSKWIGPEDRTE
jgi:GAF domain-containing protein